MGNSVYFPRFSDEVMSTAPVENLKEIDAFTRGKLLTATTLAKHFDEAGLVVVAVGFGRTGSSLLLNPKVEGGWSDQYRHDRSRISQPDRPFFAGTGTGSRATQPRPLTEESSYNDRPRKKRSSRNREKVEDFQQHNNETITK